MAGRLKTLSVQNRKTAEKSTLNQLIDIISADISNGENRRKYPSFIRGETTPVQSSLFNTIFDQDHTLQSANALFDISFGLYAKTNAAGTAIEGSTVVTELNGLIDSGGKYNFVPATNSNMMREKIDIYRQYAQSLLGDSSAVFKTPHTAVPTDSNSGKQIKEALFINIKRLFKRDNIFKGSFGMKFFNRAGNNTLLTKDAAHAFSGTLFTSPAATGFVGRSKLQKTDTEYTANQVTILDTNASNQSSIIPSIGYFSTLKMYLGNASPVDCGLIFYDMGIIVLDVDVIFDLDDKLQGVIDFPDTTGESKLYTLNGGTESILTAAGQKHFGDTTTVDTSTLKKFLQLATVDDIIKHFCESRFQDENYTALTFQNETIINSTIFFCEAAPDDFNYSTNPTYTADDGKIVVLRTDTAQPFSYITTVGLYNNAGELLAVAKLSRPIEKNPNSSLTIRVRLDY